MDEYHIPVLLNETLEYLNVQPGKRYIDCTLGGGGHTAGILEARGIVLGIDQDIEALECVAGKKKEEIREKKLILVHGNFAHLKQIASEAGFSQAAGVLFDLGVSSHQLETDYRGFSFHLNGELDMRMDQKNQAVSAKHLIAAASEEELANLIWKFGEEHSARAIAKAIIRARQVRPVTTTDQLAKIITSVRKKGRGDKTHPATRTFQALRLAVNDELTNLESGLIQAEGLLETGGRLVVISFHSLEDRITKKFLEMNQTSLRILTQKPVVPTQKEIQTNPKARSGKLRAAEKI